MNLTCEAVEDLFVLYEEDDLHPSVRKAVNEHLDNCERCTKVYQTGDGFVKTKDVNRADESITPPTNLDNQIKMKLKLRRLRIILAFLITIVMLYSMFHYIDNRKSLLYEISSMERTIRDIQLELGTVKWEGNIRLTTASHIEDLNETTNRLGRFLNLYEKRKVEDHPYQLNLNFNITNFIEVLHERYVHGTWTNRDARALNKMDAHFNEISRLLTNERLRLNHVDDYSPVALFKPFKGAKLKELFYQIDHLAYTYGNYLKFPDEISILSKEEIKQRASHVFQEPKAEVSLVNNLDQSVIQTYGTYTTHIVIDDDRYYATWDAYTGRLIEFNNHEVVQKGKLLEEAVVRDQVKKIVPHLFDTTEFRLDYKGINYHYSSNMDDKLYTYHVIPTYDGFDTNAISRLFVDARSGKTISLVTLQQEYHANLPFSVSEIKVSKEEALQQLRTDHPNDQFTYQETLYIPSVLSNQYELVHYFEKTAADGGITAVYINVKTGKEEVTF